MKYTIFHLDSRVSALTAFTTITKPSFDPSTIFLYLEFILPDSLYSADR